MARYQGRLTEWHDGKGYGFIQGITDARHKAVFLHIKNFKQQGPRPIVGCVVEYELGLDKKSRPHAINVCYVKANQVQQPQPITIKMTKALAWHPMYIVMVIYWVSLFVLSAFAMLPSLSLMVIMLVNAYTYWAYYKDKQAAIQQDNRISEQHLLLMCALGGWTAAWFAGQNFRHKTQKQPFKHYYYLSILANIGLVAFSVFVLQFSGF
mgnify:CR=1 FL=1|jgi:uncharacterized membrane protein YsdA (DUF1294 family)/cold shock CspA family protein